MSTQWVHAHKPISRLQGKQQMQSLLCEETVIKVSSELIDGLVDSALYRLQMYAFTGPAFVPVDSKLVGIVLH